MTPKLKRSASEKGISLAEILISLAVILPSLLITISILASAQYLSHQSRERLLALNAARTTIETIKDTPLQSVPGISTASFIPTGLRNGAIAITTNPVNLAGAQIATVTVTVTWSGTRNFQRSLQVTTMRSKY